MVVRGALPLVLALSLVSGAGRADEPDDGIDRWTPVYDATAAAVRMEFVEAEHGQPTLLKEPLLKYSNPVRATDQHGGIYLWTNEGRPVAVASFWSVHPPMQPDRRRLTLEWHTLVPQPLQAEYDGERVWRTNQPGLVWKRLADLRGVARGRRLRLLQMRRIAGGFGAEIERGESELRLMSQPIHRYPDDAAGVVDGAMFAFVMGTDPEFFLLLEARPDGDDGAASWYAGIVRFTNSALVVRRDGKEWWTCKAFRAGPVDQRYFLRFRVKELPADLAGTEFAVPGTADEEGSR